MDNKLYHIYLDEGGIFGDATLSINSKKLRLSTKEFHISNYYVGKMHMNSIIRYLQFFNKCFPTCKVNFHELNEIKLKSITNETN